MIGVIFSLVFLMVRLMVVATVLMIRLAIPAIVLMTQLLVALVRVTVVGIAAGIAAFKQARRRRTLQAQPHSSAAPVRQPTVQAPALVVSATAEDRAALAAVRLYTDALPRQRDAQRPEVVSALSTPLPPASVVRAWARDNGHAVSPRGRVPQTVVDAYASAHAG